MIMSDPSRPVAPFLPAEIVANILICFCPKNENRKEKAKEHPEFGPISRISNCWRVEGQRRLFETVKITGSKKLVEVVNAGLGRFISSLTIETTVFQPNHLDYDNLILLLQSVHNLKFFRLIHKSILPDFSPEDSRIVRSGLNFPRLITLDALIIGGVEWRRFLIDPILNAAHNLRELNLRGNLKYDGPIWSSSLPSLKSLMINQPSVLDQKVFDIANFQGLKSLTFKSNSSQELAGSVEFFRAVGPSLKQMKIHSLPVPGGVFNLDQIWNSLNVLEDLHVSYGAITDMNTLPSTVVKLRMLKFGSGDEATFNTLINMKKFIIGELNLAIDLSPSPPLDLLSIRICSNVNLILQSLSHFQRGNLKRLVLRDWIDCTEIIEKCKELGIILEELR